MNISELSLKRPILATVMNILIVLFGIVGYSFLAVREYPAVDPPVVNVRTSYSGANSEIIESQITEPLEKAINGIPGIRSISSSSSNGNSNITVEFNVSEDLEAAANDVRDKVSQAVRNLPQDVDAPPVVSKSDANSDFIIILAVQSQTKGLLELSEYAENVLQERFQTISEVSAVNLFGQKRPSMRLWIDPDKLNSFNVTFSDIRTALNTENVEIPSGKIYGDKTEITIKALGRLTTEKDFRDLIIRQTPAGIIRLSDVAYVEVGPENEEYSWRLNGVNAVGLSIIPQPGANYIKIADEFYKRLAEIQKIEKGDFIMTPLIDQTKNVRASIKEVEETLLISFTLVVLVIFFFFRNWLIAIRPLIDIPISLVATFFIMYISGFSINVLTLLGIVLATGLVVDDGIVVTENIFRKLESGLPIRKAALEGSKEIFFAVVSTSITLAVVFLPVIFLQGFVGSLFREFGIVVAAAVLISAFVSLTITPVLNVYLNKKDAGHGKFYDMTEPFFRGMENGYKRLLAGFLKVRWMAWVIVAICAGIIYFIGAGLQSELAPLEDRSSIRFQMSGPEGASYGYMVETGDKLLDYLTDSVPEKDFVFAAVPGFGGSGVNSGTLRIKLVDPDQRNRSQSDIAKAIGKKLPSINNARIFPVEEQTISVGLASRGSLPVQFILQNLDFEKIKTVIPKFLEEARKDKTFQNVDVNLKFNKPELQLTIDRIKAKDLGLSIIDVADVVSSAFSGRRLAYFIMNGKQYEVISQVAYKDRQKPADIEKLYVRNNRGESIPLNAVVKLEESSNPPTLYHFNRFKAATVSASLAEGMTIGDGVKAMRRIGDQLLDESFKTALNGPSRDFEESSSNTTFAFGFALILIYLVLAAQFESFKDPLTIMITVPLALAGALLSLWIFDQTINIFSQIGMIMLIGLVTKNGILIVEFANQKREFGLNKKDAVLEASAQRLRPILMTSLATALGALPIALSIGAAATSRMPLGIVIVGGIMFSLLLTLFVIPAVYTFISGKHDAKKVDITD
ncbi:MAG: acriflavin resistance protein [Sphingobacteriia bacterium 24-36-13]|jgi:HAE1 family hydrophobic/amphiphilic exporter-1/multidrug efflux pump|uniref:efflux RND transporter permease subunit n=1 Tax=Sediminibacterium sp. TaxID=1917865 RepID=UPI000BC99C18|nr:efflux RND transporter permease subunit [Sediminibacterium sp.]OYY09566.1 MAG: acriflavin resistance protein [Sphingobacteriia bacterium 35-36-14]OYZ53711.1 MAG: acriflavin resistance protein [Sphingobacteriia bacterium 24-36-13]OZA64820.1 MAG: acriflavin resistance protein [Sphingobacteriia bacterium 39-36-14]HQS24850.1 efflux RND transporter permease subunit [Sediminibacterium sp.]HQS35429.1 efflux RND transporter permease subunit [Sediminibacterium sp.]